MTYCECDCVAIDSKRDMSDLYCSGSHAVLCYVYLHFFLFPCLCLCGMLAWKRLLFTLVSCPLSLVGIPFGIEHHGNKAQCDTGS